MSDRATTWAWQQAPSSDKAWLALILLANNADDDGRFTVKRQEFADMLRCSVDTFDRRVKSLMEEQLLVVEKNVTRRGHTASTYVLAMPREFARTSGSRSSAAPGDRKSVAPRAETNQENGGAAELRLAATGAAPKKNSLTESYSEREEYSSSDAPEKKKTRFNPRWKRCSDNFRAYATSKGFMNGSVDVMFEEFRDYHLKHGSKYVDWLATWRTWVRKAVLMKQQREQESAGTIKRNDPNENRRRRHRVVAEVLEARKLGRQLADGSPRRLTTN
jgi:hypothetical protein